MNEGAKKGEIKLPKGEIKLAEMKGKSGLLEERLGVKEIDIDGAIYVIKPLPELILSMAGDAATYEGNYNGTVHVMNTIRFGLVDIVPLNSRKLLDRKGNIVKIARDSSKVLGQRYDCIRWDILQKLPMDTAKKLFSAIVDLSDLSADEIDTADFTSDSGQKA